MPATRHLLDLIAAVCMTGALPSAGVSQTKTARPPSIAPTLSGAKLYTATCAACHQANGAGLPEKYPPLAGSEIVAGDEERLIRIVLNGLRGDVEVQGEVFSGDMPGWGPSLSNSQIASVLTHVRGAWGNTGAPIATARVAAIRTVTKKRQAPWTIAELAKLPSRASP